MAARKKSRGVASRAAKRGSAGAKRKATGSAAKRGAPKKPTGVRGRTATTKKRAAKKSAARKPAVKKPAARKTTVRKTASARKSAGRRPVRKAPARPSRTPAAVPIPSAIGMLVQHMDYTTHAMAEMKRFYTEDLGFTQFTFNEQASYLAVDTGPSSSLGFMPPMPGPPEQWRPPREPAIYLMIEDVDRAYRNLVARGVQFEQAPADMPWGHRVARLRDPEGRGVCLAQVMRVA